MEAAEPVRFPPERAPTLTSKLSDDHGREALLEIQAQFILYNKPGEHFESTLNDVRGKDGCTIHTSLPQRQLGGGY